MVDRESRTINSSIAAQSPAEEAPGGATPRPAALPDPWLTLSLFVALVLLAVPGHPPTQVPLLLLVVVGLMATSLRYYAGVPAVLVLLFGGLSLRLVYAVPTSDVLNVTRAAIDTVLAGGNPYGVGYVVSTPPGAPFPYGPLTLLWYLPPIHPRFIELLVALAILVALAVRGKPLGLAIYALAPILIVTATDGSNDTSLGLLLLLGAALARRAPAAGAFVFGLAVAFKPSALAWAPPLVAWAGLPGLLGLLAGAALLWLPALLLWGPTAIVDSFVRASRLHSAPVYSLAQVVGPHVPRVVYDAIAFGGGAIVAAIAMLRVRSLDGVIVWGALIYIVTLFGGFWASHAYFAALAPVVCWHIDGWLGHDRRVRWPSLGGRSAGRG